MAVMGKALVSGAVLGLLLLSGPAMADSHSGASSGAQAEQREQKRQVYGTNMVEAGPYVELDVPTEPWRYQTFYYFAATRGLVEEDLNGVEKGLCMVGTIPIDLVTLVGAMFAGFFG